ncbi:GvpL/GvpF family gas vesicle protein [Streptomyces sp. NPDC002814]
MGLISEVLLLPFAPVRGSLWVIEQVVREAERIYYDPATIQAELARLEELLEAGEITEEEFDRLEDELLDRLETATHRSFGSRDYLRQRRRSVMAREDTWQRAERFADRLHTALSAHAERTRLHPPQNPALSSAPGQNVLNAAYLVPRSSSDEFMDVLDHTKSGESGIRIELTGPWAAYSFVDIVDFVESSGAEAAGT